MIYALGQPAAALGLVLAFLLGLAVRAVTQAMLARRLTGSTRPGSVLPRPRCDIDPFGAVGAVLGGTGWGRPAPLPELSDIARPTGRLARRRAAVYLAGVLVPIVLGELVLAGYRALFPADVAFGLDRPSDVLRGAPGPIVAQILLAVGVGLLCFGLFELIPLPPCDGWGLLWLLWRRPSDGVRKARYWLEDKNLGVVILLVLELPLGFQGPLVQLLLDLLGTPLIRVWA